MAVWRGQWPGGQGWGHLPAAPTARSPGEQTPPHEHICLSDELPAQSSPAPTTDRGTSTESPCRRSAATQMAPPSGPQAAPPGGRGHSHRDRIHYQADVRLEATEEIYLTPVQRPPDPGEPTSAFLPPAESRMSVSSDPDPAAYPSSAGRPHPSISEEDEGFDCLSSPERAGPPGGGWRGSLGEPPPPPRASLSSDTSALSYDSVKYTLVVDEHAQLELVSLRPCFGDYSDESDSATVYDNCASASSPYESAIGEEYEEAPRPRPSACLSEDSTPDEPDVHFSKKFLNVFMSGRSRSSSESAAEPWGLGGKSWREGVLGRRPQTRLVQDPRTASASPTSTGVGTSLLQPVPFTPRCRVLRALLLCHQRGGAGADPPGHIQVKAPEPSCPGIGQGYPALPLSSPCVLNPSPLQARDSSSAPPQGGGASPLGLRVRGGGEGPVRYGLCCAAGAQGCTPKPAGTRAQKGAQQTGYLTSHQTHTLALLPWKCLLPTTSPPCVRGSGRLLRPPASCSVAQAYLTALPWVCPRSWLDRRPKHFPNAY